jgi:4-methyl-5(b-hydroxyethyl)-thiazole monophosphate biosynthesis
MPVVLIPLAEGCEELEAVTLIDLLRRASIEVVVAGLQPGAVTASRGVVILPDMSLDQALQREYDMVVLPGGAAGADLLMGDARVLALLQHMATQGRYTAAICAAPKVLAQAGLLQGKQATGYPGLIASLRQPGITLSTAAVVQDGQVTTSRGPGTALDFALCLIEQLVGSEQRRSVERGLAR